MCAIPKLGSHGVPQSILPRVATGDPAAVEECLQQYGGLVWSLARRFCADHAEAEDAVQEIFIEIWRNAGRFDAGRGSEPTYITMIARRRLIDPYRRRSRDLDTTPLEDELVVSSSSQHVEQAEIREEAARAREQMQRLRPEERRVLELSIDHGLSQSEIAEVTEMPLGTVKTHSRRGLIRLRELLGADVRAAKGGGA